MAMTHCQAKLHFYNGESYKNCPFCNPEAVQLTGADNPIASNGGASHVKTTVIPPQNKPAQQPPRNEKTQLIGSKPMAATHVIKPSAGGTTPINKPANKTHIITADNQQTTNKDTAASSQANLEKLPVVGWLVIVDGPGKGSDYRLVQGNNTIGRNHTMDVCLELGAHSDSTVSRNAHAIVVYDNHANEFFIERGDSRNLPTVNGKTVRRDQDLNSGDIIQLGNTTLMFYPFCSEQFNWQG